MERYSALINGATEKQSDKPSLRCRWKFGQEVANQTSDSSCCFDCNRVRYYARHAGDFCFSRRPGPGRHAYCQPGSRASAGFSIARRGQLTSAARAALRHPNFTHDRQARHGEQVADLTLFNAEDLADSFLPGRTIDYSDSLRFSSGDRLYSNGSTELARVVQDSVASTTGRSITSAGGTICRTAICIGNDWHGRASRSAYGWIVRLRCRPNI
jgi:hypothetical protein